MSDEAKTKAGGLRAAAGQAAPTTSPTMILDDIEEIHDVDDLKPNGIDAKAKTMPFEGTPDPLLGATVAGRYHVRRKLGEGGMGAVYLALHTVLEKEVALKVLHGEMARKPELVERFMQEAKAASRIRHEHVIDVSDFGATDDGHVFFAMELLDGHDLHDELKRTRNDGKLLPWSRTKKIFLQICNALTAAHDRGIIHRDLKPENVYLVEFLGEPDFVKLLDFGIAKMTDLSGSDAERKLTKTGMLFGTPEYMSPEQARGERIDHRADIYAMGCMLFLMVSNRLPFHAENFMGILSQHLTEEPPEIAPETFDKIGAPREIAAVIDRALAKDRDERWQSIEELVTAIRDACGDPAPGDRTRPVRAPSVPSPGETTRLRTPTGEAPRPRTPTCGPRRKEPTGAVAPRAKRDTGMPDPEWTRRVEPVEVPAESLDHAPYAQPKQKQLAFALIAIAAVLGVIAIGAYAVGVFDSKPAAKTPATTAAPASTPATPTASTPTAPTPTAALPAKVEVVLSSNPTGATVTELPSNTVLGKTPHRLTVTGSTTPHRYKLALKGYDDKTVELVPDRAKIELAPELVKTGTARVNVAKPGTAPTPTAPSDPSTPVTAPDTAPVTKPESAPVTTPEPPTPTPEPAPAPTPADPPASGGDEKAPE